MGNNHLRQRGRGLSTRYIALSSTAITAALLAQPAIVKQASAQAQAAAADSGALQEVVVTARKRSEDLQKTPVSVSVVSGALAQEMNVGQFQDLRGLVTNLEVLPQSELSTAGKSVNLTIRGIGQVSVQANVDNKVGLYIDDMYIARSDGNQLGFYDIDSTQVLKGPQGTLFGKNTTAGAILVTTKRPAFDNSGFLRVRVGSFNRLDTEGAVNIPITENVLSRFSFQTQSADGYIKHKLDNDTGASDNTKSGRLQFRVLPNDDLTIDLLGEYDQDDGTPGDRIFTDCNPANSYHKNFAELTGQNICALYPPLNNPYLVYGGAISSGPQSTLFTEIAGAGGDYKPSQITLTGARPQFQFARIGTMNLRWTYDINENLSLKSITGFRRSVTNFFNTFGNNVPRPTYTDTHHTTSEQISQEIDLNGNFFDGRLNFVVGLYYSYQDTGDSQNSGPDWIDPVGYIYIARNKFLSEAIFAQGTYKVTDQLDLTLGARYNYDHKDADSSVFLQTVFTGVCGAGGGHSSFWNAFKAGSAACGGALVGTDQHNWYDFDPRAQLDYQWTPELMTYISATGGYNAGGFNQQLGSYLGGKLVPYSRERIWSYETGIKSEWFDRRLRLNLSGFYQTFDNIQTTISITYNGVGTRAVQNAAAAHQDGIEVELEAIPTADLTVRANFAYLDQAYDEINKSVTAFTLTTPVTTAARYTYSLSGNYTFHMPSEATVVAALNWRWIGSKPSCSPVGSCTTPSYGLLGGRLDYNSADRDWSVGLWATNIFDKVYYTSFASITGSGRYALYATCRPREFGLELKRNF